ncbi:MAG: plasmid pRiA4b ORF-3 family protein [Pedobacter sp.]|nr:MAG: plasmid pRiA4b ORF-3 family protein [Pedobacter sp.]
MGNIIQVKISLRGTKPLIWRRILVEKTSTFEALQAVIQIAMGWTNSHLHEFTVDGVRIGQSLDEFDMDYGEKLIDEATVTLESVLTEGTQTVDYTYDFGDSWEHTLVVEKWLPVDDAIQYPICTGGKLNCPPEDCGGIPGFYEMLRIVNEEGHPERQEMLEWLGGGYDAKAFDLQEVNRQLTAFFHSS